MVSRVLYTIIAKSTLSLIIYPKIRIVCGGYIHGCSTAGRIYLIRRRAGEEHRALGTAPNLGFAKLGPIRNCTTAWHSEFGNN